MLLQNNYDAPFWCVYELIERTEKDASNCGKGQKKTISVWWLEIFSSLPLCGPRLYLWDFLQQGIGSY